MTYLLGLCHEIQHPVLNKLQDIGHAIRTVEFHISLLLTDEGLIALGVEKFPRADEILHHIDIRPCLDIEVTGIEESTDVQTGNQFEGLVFRFSIRTLTVQIEVITLRGLEIAFLERFTMPGAIALSDIHVIHVNRHPYISRGISDLIVDMGIDEEVIGLRIAILDEIDTGLLY